MSIKGLYDSDEGDKIARRMLDSARVVDVPVKIRKKPLKKCVCGNNIMYSKAVRNNKDVCLECAKRIPKGKGGVPTSNKCALCGKITARLHLKMENKKLVCKNCATV